MTHWRAGAMVEACNCDAADKLEDYKKRVHWLNEDLLQARTTIVELRAEIQRLEQSTQ